MRKDHLLKQDSSESFGNIKEFLLVVQKHQNSAKWTNLAIAFIPDQAIKLPG